MKKLLSALLIIGSSSVFAMTTIDFKSAFYQTPDYFRCNGIKITPQTTVNNLVMNCTNTKVIMHTEPTSTNNTALSHNSNGGSALTYVGNSDDDMLLDKVKFQDDHDSQLICYFKNEILKKCKYKVKPPSPVTKAAVAIESKVESK